MTRTKRITQRRERARTRQIGPWGTIARIGVGTLFVALAVVLRPSVWDVILGVIVMPAIVVGILALRGPSALPLRFGGPLAHVANIAIAALLLGSQIEITLGAVRIDVRQASLLFYGASMLLAAWRGMGACELFAVSNALRRRDDQLGCPLFLPIDAAESARRERTS